MHIRDEKILRSFVNHHSLPPGAWGKGKGGRRKLLLKTSTLNPTMTPSPFMPQDPFRHLGPPRTVQQKRHVSNISNKNEHMHVSSILFLQRVCSVVLDSAHRVSNNHEWNPSSPERGKEGRVEGVAVQKARGNCQTHGNDMGSRLYRRLYFNRSILHKDYDCQRYAALPMSSFKEGDARLLNRSSLVPQNDCI